MAREQRHILGEAAPRASRWGPRSSARTYATGRASTTGSTSRALRLDALLTHARETAGRLRDHCRLTTFLQNFVLHPRDVATQRSAGTWTMAGPHMLKPCAFVSAWRGAARLVSIFSTYDIPVYYV